jgi:catechol 2,3-dioxygenase-like lactoylglutathione lyase family enzyme
LQPEFTGNTSIAIRVNDLGIAKKFYAETLGLKIVYHTSEMIVCDAGSFQLFIEKDDIPHPPVPSFTVESISAAKEHLTGAGCSIIREFKGGFWFKDLFGIVYDVIENKK